LRAAKRRNNLGLAQRDCFVGRWSPRNDAEGSVNRVLKIQGAIFVCHLWADRASKTVTE
jgi:hypothetical protein